MISSTSATNHRWHFFRAGGLDQVRLATGADLAHLRQLDPKLWTALACPTTGLEFDRRTLELVDTDRDGRIRVPEILAAVEWSLARLKNGDNLARGETPLALADIDSTKPEGKALLAAAKELLAALGKADTASLDVSDVAAATKSLATARFNGDGVLPPEAASDPATQQAILDIIATVGVKPDRSGRPGVDEALVTRFFAELQALADWWAKADVAGAAPSGIQFLGERTAGAYASLQVVRAKIDDYFNRCRLAAFGQRAAEMLNRPESELTAFAAKDLSTLGDDIASLPLALVGPGRPLPLVEGVNPAWSAAIGAFRSQVVAPILGIARTSVTEAEWHDVLSHFQAHAVWAAAKPATAVEKLGPARIRELLLGSARAEIGQLLARDAALATELAELESIERLVRYQRDLARLLANFVNFADFYDSARASVFQVGTLYLDSRHCDLCVSVSDAAAHAALAALSKCYIAYCDLKRPGATMKIAAVFSNGDSDFLMAGRNGLFVDRQGRDWDATITKVIDNPISIRQAFWSPYKKFVRMIEEQVAKRAAAAETAADTKLAGAAAATANADKTAPAKPAEPKKFDLALITGIGVALGSIGTMLAAIFARVLDLAWWQYPLVGVGLILVISLPSMLIAWLKLRQRTLGPILEANGWAINGRVKINIPLGTSFTAVAKLPPGAQASSADPFEDKAAAQARRRVIVLLVLGALLGAVLWVRYDQKQHDMKFFWEDRTAPATPPAAPAATTPAETPSPAK
ncbi:MAG TPA: hypothetical protein VK163_15595 [Opitutaceae bacterium]|nr:hypothetical protein [Opitutaceae bacterium]